jgi:hypothetical protein
MYRRGLVMTACALLSVMIGSHATLAQTPPEQIRDMPGLSYLGVVGGLEAWSVNGSDALWMRAPDGRALIRGDMFSAVGKDLGAALLGTGPDPANTPVTQATDVDASTTPDWSSPDAALLSSILELTRSDTFSILIGDSSAPQVWAWMDLSAAATPATYMMLRDRVEAGKISLRVIPVVTMDPGSSDFVIRLLSQADPIAAMTGRITGSPMADMADEEVEIPEDLVRAIEANGGLAGQISPPALPLLIWSGSEGTAALIGVPSTDVFDGVVRSAPLPPVADGAAPTEQD